MERLWWNMILIGATGKQTPGNTDPLPENDGYYQPGGIAGVDVYYQPGGTDVDTYLQPD